MAGFKPRSSGIGSDHSTNYATTIAPKLLSFITKRGTVSIRPANLTRIVSLFIEPILDNYLL